MSDDFLSLIRACKVFSALNDAECMVLLAQCERVEIRKGEILFKKNEQADAFYIVIEGTLLIESENPFNHLLQHRTAGRGDLVGEAGVFSHQQRLLTVKAKTDASLLKLTKEKFRQFSEKYPIGDDLLNLIKSCKLFSSLHDEDFSVLFTQLAKIDLKQGEVLFTQGAIANSLYILISGKLIASLTTAAGVSKVVGTIERGETVGELGALSGEPRTLTIKALFDSKLLKLSAEDFRKFCIQHPSIMTGVMDLLITRSQKTISLLSGKKYRQHIAVLPASPQINMKRFKVELQSALKTKNIIMLTDEDVKNQLDTLEVINQAERRKDVIIYILHAEETPLSIICRARIESVFIVADSKITANYAIFTEEFIADKVPLGANCELVLWQEADCVAPVNTHVWLKKLNFTLHHHVRKNNLNDYERLIRFMSGKAVGVVLGGGGARGWAQIGALKAILEAGIPIDAIGGTSAGAGVAACYVMEQTYKDTYVRFKKLVSRIYHPFSWRNFTWPVISLLSAKNGTESLQEMFGDTNIEDLWLPYFSISTNLSRGIEVMSCEGNLAEKLRCTSSLPGIVPPVVIDGELYVDGGLVNNLPVSNMRALLNNTGTIIAISLNDIGEDTTYYNFPPILTFKTAFMAHFKLGYREYKFPRFFDTFFDSLLVGSSNKEKENCFFADILINPNLVQYSMLNLGMKNAKQLLRIGYETTAFKLEVFKRTLNKVNHDDELL